VRYLVFDAPAMTTSFEERIAYLNDSVNDWRNEFATVHPQELCRDVAHLRAELERIESLGGEGLMLRQPGSN
jgi:DNA ligase-1